MKTILILLAAILLITTISAKEPKVGDLITFQSGNTLYEGKITGLGDGMMCVEVRLFEGTNGWLCKDYCFGTGQIVKLSWLNETE